MDIAYHLLEDVQAGTWPELLRIRRPGRCAGFVIIGAHSGQIVLHPPLHRTALRKKGLEREAANPLILLVFFGVADGARTHDNRNHNPGLYQLSYSHHRAQKYNS